MTRKNKTKVPLKEIHIICPHADCGQAIMIMSNQINCNVFRHGVYKKTNKQIDSHAKKEVCDKLAIDGLIYGCGKPFKLRFNGENYIAEICDYI
jgi:hypothetical protein